MPDETKPAPIDRAEDQEELCDPVIYDPSFGRPLKVSPEAFAAIQEAIQNPGPPTPYLVETMRLNHQQKEGGSDPAGI